MQRLKNFARSGWGKLLLSNVPFLLALNAARMADAVGKNEAPATYTFWGAVLLFNFLLWTRLTWELLWPAKK